MIEFSDIYREVKNNLQPPPDKKYRIYDFTDDEYYGDFETFFQFVILSKKDMFKGLIDEPFYFYFMDLEKNDAYASRQLNQCNVIGVSKGLFRNLIYSCKAHVPRLLELSILRGIDISVFRDARIDQFMFIVARYFLHYHELAHIIQFTGVNQFMHESRAYPIAGPFIMLEHVKERDADICGANFSARHIMDHWKRLPLALQTKDSLETLVSFGIVGIYQLFDLLSDGLKRNLYFFETSHPHTIIRISLIIRLIVQRTGHDSRMKIDLMKMIQNVLNILRNLNMDESADRFLYTMARNPLSIDIYTQTLEREHKNYPWLAGPQLTSRTRFRSKKRK